MPPNISGETEEVPIFKNLKEFLDKLMEFSKKLQVLLTQVDLVCGNVSKKHAYLLFSAVSQPILIKFGLFKDIFKAQLAPNLTNNGKQPKE